jgi:signal transduction histidine kinase
LNFPSETPELSVDADKMRIVFANLIKNACQAMTKGGELEIAIETLHLTSPQTVTTVVIRDTGAGIPVDELDRIFEPFHTTKPRGLGLGLVNVKNIVEGHGGEVCVESVVGVGTTFFIQLPANQKKEKT